MGEAGDRCDPEGDDDAGHADLTDPGYSLQRPESGADGEGGYASSGDEDHRARGVFGKRVQRDRRGEHAGAGGHGEVDVVDEADELARPLPKEDLSGVADAMHVRIVLPGVPAYVAGDGRYHGHDEEADDPREEPQHVEGAGNAEGTEPDLELGDEDGGRLPRDAAEVDVALVAVEDVTWCFSSQGVGFYGG